jgi:hypothetical protein
LEKRQVKWCFSTTLSVLSTMWVFCVHNESNTGYLFWI